MWPEELEEDEESCAAPAGQKPPPTRRQRMRHMDVDEDEDGSKKSPTSLRRTAHGVQYIYTRALTDTKTIACTY